MNCFYLSAMEKITLCEPSIAMTNEKFEEMEVGNINGTHITKME